MFFGEHEAQKVWGKGRGGAKSVLYYGALASHTHRPLSSFNHFIRSFYTINSFTQQPRNNHQKPHSINENPT